MSAATASVQQEHESNFRQSFVSRQLSHYPNTGPRTIYLGITVLATIILYYEFYLPGAVATKIITDYHMTFTYFVVVAIIANAIGAFSSLVAGLADRYGRANLVTYGLLITGLLYLLALPHAPSKVWYTVIYAFVGFVEGIMLVATPALIRDFSPQVGRGFAMGFWTLGPVLGSLVVTEVSSHTLTSHSNWRFQFYLCGIVGLAVFVIALIGLRELSPRLRDQLMVTMRDRAIVEARAAGLKLESLTTNVWRQMIRVDIVGPAFAISLFLLLYYVAAGFAVVYFATVFGYSESKANSLANWYWIANALTLVATGLLSDRIRVRKPFMIVGTLISLVGVGLFAVSATHADTTGYYHLAVLFIIIAAGGGMTYCAWMAAYTETVEKHNPAATATGLAVWGWIIRVVVSIGLLVLTFVVPATSTLVDTQGRHPKEVAVLQALDKPTAAALTKNPNNVSALSIGLGEVARQQALLKPNTTKAQADALQKQVSGLVTKRGSEVATANSIDPATLAALQKNAGDTAAIGKAQGEIAKAFNIAPPAALQRLLGLSSKPVQADLAVIQKYGNVLKGAQAGIPANELAKLTRDQTRNPIQWQHWWWVCFIAQIVFLPFVFLLTGHWNPRKARRDEQEHEALVERELAELRTQHEIQPTA